MSKGSRVKPVFRFFGTVDGVLGEITVSQPVQRDKHEWTAHLQMTGPFREDLDVHGATKKQAIDLALGLCHLHVGGRALVDQRGAPVCVPGKPLAKPTDVDDGVRAAQGVCVCLVDEGQDTVRLVLDDVTRDGSSWQTRTFYTHKRWSKKALLGLLLTEKELAAFGQVVLLRLVGGAAPRDTRRRTAKSRRR